MGSVYKRGRKWVVQYQDQHGRWRKKTAYTDKQASYQLLAKLEREVARAQTGLTDPHAKTKNPMARSTSPIPNFMGIEGLRLPSVTQRPPTTGAKMTMNKGFRF